MNNSRKRQHLEDIADSVNDEELRNLKSYLRKKLLNFSHSEKSLESWETHKGHIYDLLKRTALLAESNSVLLIGPRGCGKTTLLNGVLEKVYELKDVEENMLKVNLNGLLQTDDRIALKEITRQLQLENVVGDKVFGSFSENLTFLLEALKSGQSDRKSILFVMDEFDLFCHHKNQTLLYNLFDVAQSAQAPVAIVGLTCRLDVIELFEKRVKSRFSHRQIYLFNELSFKQYQELFVSILEIPSGICDRKFTIAWNRHLKGVVENSNISNLLKKTFELDKDLRKLKSLLIYPLMKLTTSSPLLESNNFLASYKSVNHNSKISILQGLSVLEITLLIALKRLTEVYDGEPSNFQMLYHEYQKLSQKSSMQNFDKTVVSKAFERLISLELVVPVDGINSKIQKEYQLMNLAVDPMEITDILKNNYVGLPTELQQWAVSNI